MCSSRHWPDGPPGTGTPYATRYTLTLVIGEGSYLDVGLNKVILLLLCRAGKGGGREVAIAMQSVTAVTPCHLQYCWGNPWVGATVLHGFSPQAATQERWAS
jgi:hypothetical protein